MKKLFVMALMALGMSAFAQHVTPLSIEIFDPKIDSLRALYLSEPTMYRAALAVAEQNLMKNVETVKAAKAELKVEQAHGKEMGNSLKEAMKLAAALKKIYSKEEGELKSMQAVLEKQQKTVNKQVELNQATRDNYLQILEQQQKELTYALREVAERQRSVSDLESAVQNSKNGLQSYIQETQQKAADLTAVETLLNQRLTLVKGEQKTAKTLQ